MQPGQRMQGRQSGSAASMAPLHPVVIHYCVSGASFLANGFAYRGGQQLQIAEMHLQLKLLIQLQERMLHVAAATGCSAGCGGGACRSETCESKPLMSSSGCTSSAVSTLSPCPIRWLATSVVSGCAIVVTR